MSRFHVGQRVRIIGTAVHPEMLGQEGVVESELMHLSGKSIGDFVGYRIYSCGKEWVAKPEWLQPIDDKLPNWLEIATGHVKDSAVSQELGWKRKVSA